MVMLDVIYNSKKYAPGDIIIAHFDHGTRPTSKDDAEFARKKAHEYGLEFTMRRAELGEGVSEESARKARYGFLKEASVAAGGAEIFTAHHLNDLGETVAINFLRGTGWRGLACLMREGIRRPFLEPELTGAKEAWGKKEIYQYAAIHGVSFREDPTNSCDEYLRNRIRHQMNNINLNEIYELWQKQRFLRKEIDGLLNVLAPEPGQEWQRDWFRQLDVAVGQEMLRRGLAKNGISTTTPQIERFRQAINNYTPGKLFNLSKVRFVKMEKKVFRL